MPEIVLATLNARYIHASFGLRCLRANLGELGADSALAEFTTSQRPLEIAEELLALQPRILGLGVYIWNVALTTALVALLKRLRPGLTIVLGGPEVSYECEQQEVVRLADHVITGEANLVFPGVCRQILAGHPPAAKIIPAAPPDVARLALPYDEYTDEDIAHRLVYVEASRGCPFDLKEAAEPGTSGTSSPIFSEQLHSRAQKLTLQILAACGCGPACVHHPREPISSSSEREHQLADGESG